MPEFSKWLRNVWERRPPEQCVYVGDHPVNDIEGAAAAGMNTIWIRVNQPWREGLSARPLRTIERLDELLTFI